MKIEKFRIDPEVILADHVKAKPGDFVYRCRGYDYGLASDDTAMTGIEHVSVTLNKFGDYPSFTIPMDFLEPVEPDEPIYPDDDYVKETCRIGQGEATCAFLTMGGNGWSCEKHSSMASQIKRRVEAGQMSAKGDNCEGLYSR